MFAPRSGIGGDQADDGEHPVDYGDDADQVDQHAGGVVQREPDHSRPRADQQADQRAGERATERGGGIERAARRLHARPDHRERQRARLQPLPPRGDELRQKVQHVREADGGDGADRVGPAQRRG